MLRLTVSTEVLESLPMRGHRNVFYSNIRRDDKFRHLTIDVKKLCGIWGVKCHNTRFPLPSFLCVEISMVTCTCYHIVYKLYIKYVRYFE